MTKISTIIKLGVVLTYPRFEYHINFGENQERYYTPQLLRILSKTVKNKIKGMYKVTVLSR